MANRIEKYIEIKEVPNDGKKTKKFIVLLKGTLEVVGAISWYGGWRKYVYHSRGGFYDWDCLRMLAEFCENKTKEHYHL